jgi:predicted nucleotidyltransferase
MKLYSSYLPIERYERELGCLEKYKNKSITLFNDYVPRDESEYSDVNLIVLNEPNELFGLH